MSQAEKSRYYNGLKEAGVTFDKHYREYSTEELRNNYEALVAEGIAPDLSPEPTPGAMPDFPDLEPGTPAAPEPQREELAGQRLNEIDEDQPLFTDEAGLIWYQKEVRKPATAKPRGRRVLSYVDTGAEVKEVRQGQFIETFEVAGERQSRPAEVKITLPSYQVGIYRDPRFPFKIHVYNEQRGFDLREVEKYFGGADLVPESVKRVYVSSDLCYDIRSVVRTIEAEYRRLQLS